MFTTLEFEKEGSVFGWKEYIFAQKEKSCD